MSCVNPLADFPAAICDDVVANLGAFDEGGETCPLDRRYMDEDILAAGMSETRKSGGVPRSVWHQLQVAN
jgi:hypothetical protein